MASEHPFKKAEAARSGANPFKQRRQKRHLLTIGLAASVLVLAGVALYLYLRSQQTGILIVDTGATLKISVNGKVIQPEATEEGYFLPVYAGQYRLQIERTDYAPFVADVTTVPGTIYSIRPAFSLMPNSSTDTSYDVNFVRPSPDGKSLYYLSDNRTRLYRLEVGAQSAIPLTDRALSGVTDVQWSSSPYIALLTQGDGTYLHEIPRFDFKNQIFVQVAGREVISPVWDPNNPERIAAAYFPPSGERSIVLSDKRFSDIRRIFDLRDLPQPRLVWSPDSYKILLIGQGANPDDQNLWLLSLNNGQLQQLTTSGGITDASFSPDSSKLLYQYEDNGTLTRAVLTIADGTISTIPGSIEVRKTAWKDNENFFEPGIDGQSLVLRSLSGSFQTLPISLTSSQSIESLFYFKESGRIMFATPSSVYSVAVDN